MKNYCELAKEFENVKSEELMNAIADVQRLQLVAFLNEKLAEGMDVEEFAADVLENEITADQNYYELSSWYSASGRPEILNFK